jgi:2'-5' RNA ligase
MAVKQYFAEKATGRRPLAIYIVGGMSTELIEKGLNAAQDGASSRGIVSHMGATVIGNANPLQPTIATIPLAELPDGFDQQKHEELTQIRFANALGIDPSELNPRLIGNRQLGAGSQSQVLDDKQESKGLIALRQKLLAFLNDTDRWHLLPGGVTFAWNERDFNDQQIKAGTAQTRATTRAAQIASGEISADEARQLAVDAGDLPETFISIDRTDEETLTDEDKADAGDVAQLVDAPSSDTTLSDAQPLRADSRGIVQNVAQKSHEGAMIALYPDDAGKDALAQMRDAVEWPAGSIITPPDEYHVTMAYLGKAADISAEGRTSIVQQIEPLRTVRVIEARFNGVARFNGTPESGDAIVVLLSEPALIEMAGFARGIGDESEHPFNAHITLAYIPHDAATPTVPAMFETLNLDTLSAVFAGARVDFPFASETTKKALAAFKAARTTLVTISPQLTRRPSDRANVRGYYEQVTRELRAYMRVLVDKCKQYCPVDSGALRNSITYEVKSPVTAFARGVLYAGNAERPEKVVRSVLHGRRGFGPKDPNGTLAFETADGTVFTKHVSAARGNDWFARAWKDTEHERRVMARRIGKLTNDAVSMRDVPLTNAEHIDGYDERAGDTVPNTARWRKAGGLQ